MKKGILYDDYHCLKVLIIEMKLSAMTTQQLIRVFLQDMIRQQV